MRLTLAAGPADAWGGMQPGKPPPDIPSIGIPGIAGIGIIPGIIPGIGIPGIPAAGIIPWGIIPCDR